MSRYTQTVKIQEILASKAGLKVVSKAHTNCQDKGNLGIGKGLKVVSKVHANRQDKGNLNKQYGQEGRMRNGTRQ